MRLWNESLPARGTVAEAYLRSRGLAQPDDDADVLGFHSRCPRRPARLPAMVALRTDPVSGEPTGVHRMFLRADGLDRLRDEKAKAILGRVGVIRLTLDAQVTRGLGLAEGVETALAVMQRLG